MNKFSLVSQIAMIAIAVAIVILYIKPQITSIRETQDLVSSYEVETENVSQVNETLKAKIAAIEAIAPEDARALARFIPDSIDEISVLKDISTILETQSVKDYDLKYQGNNIGASDDEVSSEFGPLTEHYFSVGFETTYAQLKTVLSKMETNDYLLQVSNLKITDAEDGLVKVDMSLTAFTRLIANAELN